LVLGVKNLGGGEKVFKVKRESKGNILKISIYVQMLKLRKIRRDIIKRRRR